MENNLDFKDAPFIKRVRETGLRAAVGDTVNDIVYRTTNGINVAELRAMLRGDDPLTRPNPRLRPHADSFWMHIRPGYYNKAVTGVYPYFRLGWLSTYFFAFEAITGLFLMVFYTPSTNLAYDNMLAILSNVPLGQFMRDLHRLGAEAMVLFVALHMLRTYVTASYKYPRGFTWVTGMLLLVITMGLSFTGYLLPWDQLAYWAVTIGASMAEATPPPIVGRFVNILLKGSPDLGQAGLLRFYLLHVFVLPLVGLALLGMHYYKVVLYGHSLPPELEKTGEDSAKRVPVSERVYYLPDLFTSDLWLAGITTFLMIVAVIFFYDAPLENQANPLDTPFHTVAPWYFLWIQGLLKLGDKTFMGVILPTILLLMFMVMPYVDVGPVRYYAKRRLAISVSMLFIATIAVLSWMGTPFFLVQSSLDQEIYFKLAPLEKVGDLHRVPYDDLYAVIPMGAIDVLEGDWEEEIPESSGLYHALEVYKEEVEEASEVPLDRGGLPEAQATLQVVETQPKLVTVNLQIVWVGSDGNPIQSDLSVPIHEYGYAAGGAH